jgi:hypothetical protein
LDLDPAAPFGQWCWSWILTWNRRFEEAWEAVARMKADNPASPFTPLAEALSLAVDGQGAEALAILSDLPAEVYRSNELLSREVAHCFSLAGDVERGLSWLRANVEIGNINYPFLRDHDWFLDNLRPDPRFGELMEEVKGRWEAFDL